jgi:hypothetical protein
MQRTSGGPANVAGLGQLRDMLPLFPDLCQGSIDSPESGKRQAVTAVRVRPRVCTKLLGGKVVLAADEMISAGDQTR